MTSNSRPVFCFYKDPKLLWNEVSGALSYKFRLVNQATSEELWTIEVNNPQFEDGYYQCDYPQDKKFLEPLVSYLLIGEAKDGESLKKLEAEVILLEEKIQQAIQEFEALLESEGTEALKDRWLTITRHLSSPYTNGTRNGTRKRNCGRGPCGGKYSELIVQF